MKTFRIGNEIQVRWPILTNGNETPLTGRNLKLFLSDDTGRKKEIAFETEDNYVYFTYSPLEQKHVGVYFLTLFEDMGMSLSFVPCLYIVVRTRVSPKKIV